MKNAKQYCQINYSQCLMALNSVDIFQQGYNKRSLVARTLSGNVYNAYYKYHELLKRFDFFEHLNIQPEQDAQALFSYKFDSFGPKAAGYFSFIPGRGIRLKNAKPGSYALIYDGQNRFQSLMGVFSKCITKDAKRFCWHTIFLNTGVKHEKLLAINFPG